MEREPKVSEKPYTFKYKDGDVLIEYTILNSELTHPEMREHFDQFLKACGFIWNETTEEDEVD
jgi:hypothetical protein